MGSYRESTIFHNVTSIEVTHIVAVMDARDVHINKLSLVTIRNGTLVTPVLNVKFSMEEIILPTLAINATTTPPILQHS
ncbi:hypothetical protein RDI58_000960 [Solanum bulbocastanum]|uniref:Uncharacterized protein n=1 Tax=Solanum bulbocastanum TaxID=147425 RepID=A0AAN8YPP8_SOLBU